MAMAAAVDFSHYVAQDGETARIELALEGADCAACIDDIEGALKRLPGIVSARLNFTSKRLTVAWDRAALDVVPILDALARLGYRAHPFRTQAAEEEEARQMRWLLTCLAVAGFAAMNIMLLSVSVWSGNVTDITSETRDFFHWLSALIALPAAAYAGQPFFRSALAALRSGRLNMDVPISLGVLLALGMSVVETAHHAEHAYFDSAVMLLFFLLGGRVLDHTMRRKTRSLAGNLAALRAEVANRLDETGEVSLVPTAALGPGDRVLVRPGDRIPVDGAILSGRSEIDDSLVTGETMRRPAGPGDAVYAGSQNFDGALTVRVTAAGEGTLLDEVERLLEAASAAKLRYVRLADRAARLYAPVVHTTAALTAIGWLVAGAGLHDAVVTAICVLIITCPCALALAVPAVQVVAANQLFRAGLLLNSGDAIERLADVDTIVFDKTGTLTLPEPSLVDRDALRPDLLQQAARLALSSRHPLAAALAREASGARPYFDVREEPGRGVAALAGGTELRLGSPAFCSAEAEAERLAAHDPQASIIAFAAGDERAVFGVRQALRADAVETVRRLAAQGFDLHILSGDRPDAVAPVAAELGIATWKGGVKPADKIAAIEALQAEGRRVLMVGDGINDAPALAAAHVSLSPIDASDLAQAKADAVFLGERLAPVEDALSVACLARRLMRQNLMLAIVYNAIAVPIAIAGLVTPLVAAAAMSGSSVLVTLNALRGNRRRTADPAPVPAGAARPLIAGAASP